MPSQNTVCRSTAVDTAEAEGETETSNSNVKRVVSFAATMTALMTCS